MGFFGNCDETTPFSFIFPDTYATWAIHRHHDMACTNRSGRRPLPVVAIIINNFKISRLPGTLREVVVGLGKIFVVFFVFS